MEQPANFACCAFAVRMLPEL